MNLESFSFVSSSCHMYIQLVRPHASLRKLRVFHPNPHSAPIFALLARFIFSLCFFFIKRKIHSSIWLQLCFHHPNGLCFSRVVSWKWKEPILVKEQGFKKMSFKKLKGGATEKTLSPEEQQAKIVEVRKIIGPIADKFPALCSDASILRFLRARKYNTRKAAKMLKGTIKWRLEFKPEKIQWDDVAQEAVTGRLYRADYLDKQGRIVLVMRPGVQNTNSTTGQIKYLVYCLENAILNLSSNQEQMVWLIDFQGWSTSSISLKVTKDAAQILQDHYPERLGLAIFYNPPKMFESFWTMVKPFLEPKTSRKVTFVYSENPRSRMMMEELFDMDKLESYFGGRNTVGPNYEAYAQKMRDDDRRMSNFIDSGCSSPGYLYSEVNESQHSEDNGSEDETSSDEAACSNLEEDDEIIQGQMPCSQDEPKNEVHEPKKV